MFKKAMKKLTSVLLRSAALSALLSLLFCVAAFADDGERSKFDAGPLILRGIVCLAIGFFIAAIITGSMKSKLYTVRSNNYASEYIVPHSFTVTRANEVYLYNKIDKIARPQAREEDEDNG
ncbi:MAG: hypothetical protein II789_06025 [Clostridia bacterium]|nr:hypothetical protein [Clostridia bacterium]